MISRRTKNLLFFQLCRFVTYLAILILCLLIFHVLKDGFQWLSWGFIDNFPSRFPAKAGVKSALYGSIWLLILTALFVVPFGVASAIFLEEYAPKNWLTRMIQINISNLAGMPSIVYGLVGLAVFVRFFGFGTSVLSASLTLSLLVLPVIIIASQESIKAVPRSIKDAAYALGARRWQVVFLQVLPAAIPGVMTGVILSISRAIGETAPLVVVGALSYVAFTPEGPLDDFTALPMQIYNWASRPGMDFHGLAAAGIVVLLVLLLTMNAGAIFIRQKFQKYKL